MSRIAKDSEVDEWLDAYLEEAEPGLVDGELGAAREALRRQWVERRGREGQIRRYHGGGCERCGGSGLGRRTAVHELLVVTRPMRRLLRAGAPAWELHRQALVDGMRSLRQDAIDKVLAGLVPTGQLRGLADLAP